jgi:hypothetical protein
MQPLTTAGTAEDLDDVLGRFHAWAKTHKTAHKSKEIAGGVREISCEEALDASRRRWQSHPSGPLVFTHNEKSETGRALEDDAIAPDTVILSTGTQTAADRLVGIEKPLPVSFGRIFTETISTDISSGPLALVWPTAPKAERQVSMSFRVPVSEQALIKARAAEADLSVSAYVRQCALEVEELRACVRHTLALVEQGHYVNRSLDAKSPPAIPTARGLLARLRQRIFGTPTRLTQGA